MTTAVTAGINYTLETVFAETETDLKKCQKRLAAIDKEITDLKGRTLTAAASEKITELAMTKTEVEQQIATLLEARRNDAVAYTKRVAVPMVIVRGTLYPGVAIRLGDCRAVTDHTMQGPLKLTADRNDGTVHFIKVDSPETA